MRLLYVSYNIIQKFKIRKTNIPALSDHNAID